MKWVPHHLKWYRAFSSLGHAAKLFYIRSGFPSFLGGLQFEVAFLFLPSADKRIGCVDSRIKCRGERTEMELERKKNGMGSSLFW